MKIIYLIKNDLCVDIQRIADNVPISSDYLVYDGRELPAFEDLSTTEALNAYTTEQREKRNLGKVWGWLSGNLAQFGLTFLILKWLYLLTIKASLQNDPDFADIKTAYLAIKRETDNAIDEADLGNESDITSNDITYSQIRNFLP